MDDFGIARVDGKVHYVQQVDADNVDKWKSARRMGSMDVRTIGKHVDGDGTPFVEFREAAQGAQFWRQELE